MKILTVLELTRQIKGLLENDRQLNQLWVQGEISNFKRAASGHLYLTLKDAGATVRVVMFRSRARLLKCNLEDGLAVKVRGSITVFEQAGQYQINAQEIEPDGAGALFAAMEKLKQKLSAEGLFDVGRKKELPRFPRRIGLVTSPTGAVIQDMMQILRRRWPGIELVLAPVAVQGAAAAEEVARAVELFNRQAGVDLLIVGRGGGSLEELGAFNSERVARSIAASVIPVISAVGHETDFTIADLAADLRAPTPSAAAEMAVPDGAELTKYIALQQHRLQRIMRQRIAFLEQRLGKCAAGRVFTEPVALICDQRRQTLDLWDRGLRHGWVTAQQDKASQLALAAGRLDALSPLATLSRGYSIAALPGGELLRDAAQAVPGSQIQVTLQRGALLCTVDEQKNDGFTGLQRPGDGL